MRAFTCPKCGRSVTLFVGKNIPIRTKCGKRMEERKPKGKTA